MDFTEKFRLRGQAEEDLYFAELDRQLIEAMHKRQQEAEQLKQEESGDSESPPSPASK